MKDDEMKMEKGEKSTSKNEYSIYEKNISFYILNHLVFQKYKGMITDWGASIFFQHVYKLCVFCGL